MEEQSDKGDENIKDNILNLTPDPYSRCSNEEIKNARSTSYSSSSEEYESSASEEEGLSLFASKNEKSSSVSVSSNKKMEGGDVIPIEATFQPTSRTSKPNQVFMESKESSYAERHPIRRKKIRSHRSTSFVDPRISDESSDPEAPSTCRPRAVKRTPTDVRAVLSPSPSIVSYSDDSEEDEEERRGGLRRPSQYSLNSTLKPAASTPLESVCERPNQIPRPREERPQESSRAKSEGTTSSPLLDSAESSQMVVKEKSASSKPLLEPTELVEQPKEEDYNAKKYKKIVRLSPCLDADSPDREICENDTADVITYELFSPINGKSLAFNISADNTDETIKKSQLVMHLSHLCMSDKRIKDELEREFGKEFSNMQLQWNNNNDCKATFDVINGIIANFSIKDTHDDSKTSEEWFSLPVLTEEQCKTIAMIVYDRAVKKASVLNTCYKAFSSQVYGETSFEQLQIIFKHLKLTKQHVFVDLGSGVGQVVTYAAAFSNAKCVGIEINEVPAKIAVDMKKEMERMMAFYGKDCGEIEMRWSSLLNFKHRSLITEEADVIFVNNYAFDAPLTHCLKQLILLMKPGTRIVCTKSLTETRRDEENEEEERREDEVKDGKRTEEARKIEAKKISNRARAKRELTVDMILDEVELPLADAPVSWATGKNVKFIVYTVNYCKIEEIFNSIPDVIVKSDENEASNKKSKRKARIIVKKNQSTTHSSIGSKNIKGMQEKKECNRDITEKDSNSVLSHEIGATHKNRGMKRKVDDFHEKTDENEEGKNENLSRCSRVKLARTDMDADKYDFSLHERIFAKSSSASTAVYRAIIENIEERDDGPFRYWIKFDGEDRSCDHWVYKDELIYQIFSEEFVEKGGFVEGDDHGFFVGSLFTGMRECKVVQKKTYTKGEKFLCKSSADAIVAWPARILRVETVKGRDRYCFQYTDFASRGVIEPHETNLKMEKYSNEKHNQYKKVNSEEIEKKEAMKKIFTTTSNLKKGKKIDCDRTQKVDSPFANKAQNGGIEKDTNEVEKKERKKWKAFVFKTNPLEYYPFHVSELLKIHKLMPVGATSTMWWEDKNYQATCIAKDTKSNCEKLIRDLINGDRTMASLNLKPPQKGSRGRPTKRKMKSKAVQKKAKVEERESENDDEEIDTTGVENTTAPSAFNENSTNDVKKDEENKE